jgi:hypothetical protein
MYVLLDKEKPGIGSISGLNLATVRSTAVQLTDYMSLPDVTCLARIDLAHYLPPQNRKLKKNVARPPCSCHEFYEGITSTKFAYFSTSITIQHFMTPYRQCRSHLVSWRVRHLVNIDLVH